MLLDMPDMHLSMLINLLNVGYTGAVLVYANVVLHTVFSVDISNFTVDPVYLRFLVAVIFWFRAVIPKPGKLRGVKEGTNSDGVTDIILIFHTAHILNKTFDGVDNVVPAVTPHQVIVPCDDKYIYWFGMVRVLQLISVENGLKCGTRDSHIIGVLGVPFILRSGGGGRGKEVMECGVRQNNLCPFCWIRRVVTFA